MFVSGLEIKRPAMDERTSPMKASMRDVSVSCVAMTRDVGISHTEPAVTTRDVGISHVPARVTTRDIGTSHIQTPVPTRDATTCHKELVEFMAPNTTLQSKESVLSLQKEMVSLKNIIQKPEFRDISTVTDLLSKQIYTDTELDTNINKAIKMFEKTYLSKLQKSKTENTFSIGVQVTPSPIPLKIIEKSDRGVQAVEEKHLRSYGVNCSPRMSDAQVYFHPETRTVGVSEDSIDMQCEKCVNESNTLSSLNNNKKLSLATLNVVRSKSFDYSDRSPLKKPRTRSVACGPLLRITGTKSCDTSDLVGRSKDIGVNTVKRKLVDAAVGDSVQKTTYFNICDKCSNTIKSVAKDILNQSRGDLSTAASPLVSRIPRPTTLPQQLSSPDKPKFSRQDTYTKTFPELTPQTSPSPTLQR